MSRRPRDDDWLMKQLIAKYANSQRAYFLIFGVSVVVRFAFILTLRDQYYWPDEIDYDAIARRLVEGRGYGEQNARGPLYSFFLYGIYSIVGPQLLTVRVIQSLIDSFSAVLVTLLGKSLFNRETGVVAGLGYAIYPFFVYFPGMLLSETLYSVLFLAMVLTGDVFLKSRQARFFIIHGLLLGLAILCRPFAIVFLPSLAIYWFCVFSSRSYRHPLLNTAAFLLCGIAVVLPWSARNYIVHDQFIFVSNGGGRELWYGSGPYSRQSQIKKLPESMNAKLLQIGQGDYPGNEEFHSPQALQFIEDNPDLFGNVYIDYERDRFLYSETFNFVLQNPLVFVKNYVYKVVYFWTPSIFTQTQNPHTRWLPSFIGTASYGILLTLFILGVLSVRRRWDSFVFIYLVLGVHVLGSALFTASMRYRLPIEPLMLLFGSYFLVTFLRVYSPSAE